MRKQTERVVYMFHFGAPFFTDNTSESFLSSDVPPKVLFFFFFFFAGIHTSILMLSLRACREKPFFRTNVET